MTRHYLHQTIAQYIFFFFLASILGYCWEVILVFVIEGTLCNRGFLYGPYLPVYGVGAVLMLLLLRPLQKRPVLVFLLAGLLGSVIEYLIGLLLYQVWGLRYWDYSTYPLNLSGYICLYSILGFAIAGVLWVCILARLASFLWHKIPARRQHIILTLLVLVFMIDCCAALLIPNKGTGVTF